MKEKTPESMKETKVIEEFELLPIFFQGVKRFLREVVEECRRRGWVQTMGGRRRCLKNILHSNPHAKAHVRVSEFVSNLELRLYSILGYV